MKHKVSQLDGELLNAAVARCEGLNPRFDLRENHWFCDEPGYPSCVAALFKTFGLQEFCPASNWSIGGPIIDRERIGFFQDDDGAWLGVVKSSSDFPEDWSKHMRGAFRRVAAELVGPPSPTPIIAAMRAFVMSKFGDEVDLP